MTLERLEWAASTGLDLSPGDPVAAWAVGELRQLRSLIATALDLVEEDWAGTSADSRGQLWLRSARAALGLVEAT